MRSLQQHVHVSDETVCSSNQNKIPCYYKEKPIVLDLINIGLGILFYFFQYEMNVSLWDFLLNTSSTIIVSK